MFGNVPRELPQRIALILLPRFSFLPFSGLAARDLLARSWLVGLAAVSIGVFNVLRLSLHPDGLAPRIVNLGQWRAHLLARLRRQIEISADTTLMALLEELSSYPAPEAPARVSEAEMMNAFVVPFRLATPAGVLSFISTTTVFGTPIDVTLSELALETFFPADAATAAALRLIGALEEVAL